MMDYATKVIPGKYIEGYKIKKNEWFKVHWPETQICLGCCRLRQWFKCSLIILTLPGMKNKIFILLMQMKLNFIKKYFQVIN